MPQYENVIISSAPDLAEQTQVFEEAAGHHGSISAAMERYGGDISKCPYLQSLGSAGVALIEQMQAAEKDPNRGPTIAEVLAAKKAQREAEAVAPVHEVPNRNTIVDKTVDLFSAKAETASVRVEESNHIMQSTVAAQNAQEASVFNAPANPQYDEILTAASLAPEPIIRELLSKPATENTPTTEYARRNTEQKPEDNTNFQKLENLPALPVVQPKQVKIVKPLSTSPKKPRLETQLHTEEPATAIKQADTSAIIAEPNIKNKSGPSKPEHQKVDILGQTTEITESEEQFRDELVSSLALERPAHPDEMPFAESALLVEQYDALEKDQSLQSDIIEGAEAIIEQDGVAFETETEHFENMNEIILSFLDIEQTPPEHQDQSSYENEATSPILETPAIRREKIVTEQIAEISIERKQMAAGIIKQIESLGSEIEQLTDAGQIEKSKNEMGKLCEELFEILLPDMRETELKALIVKILAQESNMEVEENVNLPQEKGTMERKTTIGSTISNFLVHFLHSRPFIVFLGRHILKTSVLIQPGNA